MAQTLLIGVGGTGSRVVNNVVKELHRNHQSINTGDIYCAVFDTNTNDTETLIASNTGVPVFPTSKPQKIRDYFDDYSRLHMEKWCPQSPSFMEGSMIDGASELRIKSRIAFLDCMESNVMNRFDVLINDMLKGNTGSKIRIMIVSSLSGGTGSGMFIQMALWLRKRFNVNQITIRGIFLLPDIFISTVKDIRDSKKTMVRHYCNAYAAIRELNALTKISKSNSVELAEKIALDGLFDSTRDQNSGKPVFDFAFFIDDKDENGVRLNSIDEYEKMVAQLVYMQLYAPMRTNMYSEEDNTFLPFTQNEEPLYGSCGTSKAVYPLENVKTYCAIRAAQDSLTSGWEKIDNEINTLMEEKKQLEKDGIFTSDTISIREEFVKLFDEKSSVKAEETGRDRFFLSIANDIKNETRVKLADDKVGVQYTDKVEDFIDLLKNDKIDAFITRYSATDDFAIDADAFVSADHTKEELIAKVKSDENGLNDVLDAFDKKVEEYADRIVNSVFPFSMGDVKAQNRHSIYGLLTKQDTLGHWRFVHPVAARYLLYKLVEQLKYGIEDIVLSSSREDAKAGGDIGTLFDNKATRKTETDPISFLNSKKWYQGENAFLDDFERRYAQFITGKIALCEKYEKECLLVNVYQKLTERVNGLILEVEGFFQKLQDVHKKFDDALAQNILETSEPSCKTVYVFAGQQEKESIYQSMAFELSNNQINKNVIDAIYGHYCAKKRPSNSENAKYTNVGVITTFVREIVQAFKYQIDHNDNNRENVDFDIYTAVCKASDLAFQNRGGMTEKTEEIDRLDVATGQLTSLENEDVRRHNADFTNFKDQLHRMAAPFLIHSREIPNDEFGTVTTLTKTFWGFSPDVIASYPQIGATLGVNADIQADKAYPKNELYCYRAVYGLEAAYIPKFNELENGDYYKYYRAIVDDMVKNAEGRQGVRAYIQTPHLDMNWHRILPYVTKEKQQEEELKFYHGFWLAVAYGALKTGRDGTVCIRRSMDSGYGSYINEDVDVAWNGKRIANTDLEKLIQVLKTDKTFTGFDLPQLEHRFANELEEMTDVDGTDALKGLTRQDEWNPIHLISCYDSTPRRNKFVAAALVGSLEKIAEELIEKSNPDPSEKQFHEEKYRTCKKIYDAGAPGQGESALFSSWKEAFEKFHLAQETESNPLNE